MNGKRLRELRRKKKLTQQAVAKYLGVTEKTISRYEKMDMEPRYSEVYTRLGELFQVPPEYFREAGDWWETAPKAERGTTIAPNAQAVVNDVVGLFAGGELSEEDKKAVLETIQEAYYIAKLRNKKFAPRKYRQESEEEPE